MQQTGNITNIVQTAGYDGRHGHVHTYDLTVDIGGGDFVTGEIGSKSSPYPKAIGDEITVEVNHTEHGVKLKAVNPQYAGDSGGSSTQRAPGGSGGTPSGSTGGSRDFDKENRGKIMCNLVSSAIRGGQLYPGQNEQEDKQAMDFYKTKTVEIFNTL